MLRDERLEGMVKRITWKLDDQLKIKKEKQSCCCSLKEIQRMDELIKKEI